MNLRNLGVIGIESCVLKGILRTLQQVVEVPPPGVRRIKLCIEFDRSGKSRLRIVSELRHHGLAVLPSFSADQHAVLKMAIVVID